MWILIARTPRPDAPYWPGRLLLAAADAIAWPLVAVVGVLQAPSPVGVVGPVVVAVAMLFALGRLQRALFHNERYRFTSWWLARVLMALLLIGFILKFTTSP